MQRFAAGGADNLDVIRPALVGDVGVELDARIMAVMGVHVALRLTAPTRPEILAIRGGRAAIAEMAEDNYRLRRDYARITGDYPAGAALLRRSRRRIEEDLARFLERAKNPA